MDVASFGDTEKFEAPYSCHICLVRGDSGSVLSLLDFVMKL